MKPIARLLKLLRSPLWLILLSSALCNEVLRGVALADDFCVIQLSEPRIDYGEFNRSQPMSLQRGGELVPVGKRAFTLSATCKSSTSASLSFKGERGSERGYRFAKGGVFTLKVIDAELDGKTVQLRSLNATQNVDTESMIKPGDELAAYDGPYLAQGKHLTVQIEIASKVSVADTIVIVDEEWEGSGHFEIHPLQPN